MFYAELFILIYIERYVWEKDFSCNLLLTENNAG